MIIASVIRAADCQTMKREKIKQESGDGDNKQAASEEKKRKFVARKKHTGK
jgi:hypothetical protein